MGMDEKENSQTSRSSFRRMYVGVEVRKKKKKKKWRRYSVWVGARIWWCCPLTRAWEPKLPGRPASPN